MPAMPDTAHQVAASATGQSCVACDGAMLPWVDMPIDPMREVPTAFGRANWCDDCGVGSIAPLPAAAEISAFYEMPTYYTHGGARAVAPLDFFDRVVLKLAWWRDAGKALDPARIAKHLPRGASICDLGCGQAEHLVAFKRLGFNVIGVDPDPVARQMAAQAGVTVLDGTADEGHSSLPDAAFDLVVMTHSLEHCRDPKRALATCARLLKPGGILYCEVPNCACTHFRDLTICSTMFDAPRHLHFFEPRALRRMLVAVGLIPEDELYSGYARQHSRDWRDWETSIARQLRQHSPNRRPVTHTRLYTLWLLARTAFSNREAKYDSFGIFARRSS